MILFRVALICLIIYLIVKSFGRFGKNEPPVTDQKPENKNDGTKKISKEIGEYVDYEEVDDKD